MASDLNSKEFIEKLLKTPIKTFEIKDGCKKGDNVAGSLKSIVAVAESGETISVVHKLFPAQDNPTYGFIKEGGIFRTEGDAYTVLANELEEFVNSRIDQSKNPSYSLPMPKYYAHFNDDENDYITLEDIRPQGFIMSNVFNGLSYPETRMALQALARIHAYSYAFIRCQGEVVFSSKGKLSRFIFDTWRTEEKSKEMHIMMSGSVQNSIEIIQKTNPQLAKVMQEKIPAENAGALMDQCYKLTDVKLFPCIVHGDFWSNNFLLKYDSERNPVDIKFVDFQLTRRGNIFEDLVYFIFTSTDTEFRKKYLTQVLRDYYESFKAALESINFPMPIGFTLGFLIDTFYSLAKGSLVNMCFAIPLQMGKPSEPPSEQPKPEEAGVPTTEETKNEAADDGKGDLSKSEPSAEEQAIMFLKMFVLNLRQMIENSPPALKRLEEIAEEVLLSGRF